MAPTSRVHASFSFAALAAVRPGFTARLPRALPLPQVDQLAAPAAGARASAAASTTRTAAAVRAGRSAHAHPLPHAIAAGSYRPGPLAPVARRAGLTACLQRGHERGGGMEVPEGPAAALRRLTNGYQVSQAIHVAAVLGLADELAAGPRASDDLAAATGTHPGALYRLLRALAAVGLLEEHDERRFALAPLGEPLRSDAPDSVAGWAAFVGRGPYWQ